MTGGGSGGHIVPLLSLAHELKSLSPDCQIIYIGHKGDNFDSLDLPKNDFDFLAFINGGKFRRYHNESFLSHFLDIRTQLLNLRDLFRVIRSVGSAYRILKRTKAEIVFAKGGFISVPVGIAARLIGLPIVTHDSDTVGGLANRIVGRWAVVRATGMPTKFYPNSKARLEYVGIPLSEDIKRVTPAMLADYKKKIGVPSAAQILLVAGGGLGSQIINQLVVKTSPRLLQNNLSLQIVHITGQQHLRTVVQDYAKTLDKAQKERVVCLGFTPNFQNYSGASDLIISRAGATAIAEFAVQAKACIIMPSPFLTGGHQLKNAQELAKNSAAVVLSETTDPDELAAVVNQLLSDDHRRAELAMNIAKLAKPGAAKKLARIILEVIG